jgi:hypothetical protein
MAYALFGSYSLDSFSGGVGNIIRSKDVSSPIVTPVTSNVSRRYGSVKNGELVGARDVDIELKIVGTSRSDLIARLDALKKALRLRGQFLVIYEDGRLFQNVDCLEASAKLAGGANVLACVASLKFKSYDPMAYAAASSSYDTGTVALTLASGVYNFPAIPLAGGGTVESYPLIRITNKTSGTHQWTAISITQTTDSQTITTYSTAGVPLPANVNDYVDIQCDPATGFSIQTNGSGLLHDPIGVFPTLNPDSTTFNISVTSASAVSADALFSWTSRYL